MGIAGSIRLLAYVDPFFDMLKMYSHHPGADANLSFFFRKTRREKSRANFMMFFSGREQWTEM